MRLRIAFALSALITGISFLPAQAAYNSTKPAVTKCSVNNTTISDSGGSLQITLHIIDPTPVTLAVINVMNSAGDFIAFGSLSLQAGTSLDGDWTNTFSVKPNLKPGIYSVVAQHIMDESQNDLLFYSCPGLNINYGSAQAQTKPTPSPTPSSDSQNPAMSAAQQTLAAAKYAFCIAQNSLNESAAKIAGTTPPSAPDCGVDPATVIASATPSAISKTPDTSATDLIAAFDSVNAKLSAYKDWVLQIKNQFPTHQVAIDMYSSPVFKFGPVNTIAKADSLTNLLVTQQSLIENAVKQWEKTAPIKSSLICTKGKITKKVSGINPKCPVGYKVKK
jgi:hypothetical protein